jgi:protein phosphatase
MIDISDWSSTTNTGRVRRNNEDAYLVAPPLFVVADGMGGAQAGELASRLCIEAFRDAPLDGRPPLDRMRSTIEDANRRVLERARSDAAAAGMGSTVTAAVIDGGFVYLGHVGDSRAYLLRDGVLQQLSRDHTLVNELVRQGKLTSDEAESHPQRSVITRALGAGDQLDIDLASFSLRGGDVLLLCSDGLSSLVDDDTLGSVLGGPSLDGALRDLVARANAAGGDDNITAIAVRVEGAVLPGEAPPGVDTSERLTPVDGFPRLPFQLEPSPRRRRPLRAVAAVLALLLVAGAAVAGSIAGLRYAHFVGVDPATGHVAVFQGLPIQLSSGRTLYHRVLETRVVAATLPASERARLFDHEIRSEASAMRIVRRLAASQP